MSSPFTSAKSRNFAVIDTDSDTFVGGCGLNQVNWSHGNANLFYWIRTSRTGEGFATQGVLQTAHFGFETPGLIRVEIIVAVGNKASIRVAEKTGATREGTMRNKLRTGERVQDAIMYSLLPGDTEKDTR